MKQRRFGQKVQNWHRPLRPNELCARYLRQRGNPAGIVTVGGISQELPDINNESCDYWYQDLYEDEVSAWDIQSVKHANLVWSICHTHYPLSALKRLLPLEAPTPPLTDCANGTLITQLAEHLKRVTEYNYDDPELIETIQEVLRPDARAIVQQHLPKLAEELCLFAPFWNRSPLTWNPEQGCSLLEHLFVVYPVPPFLIQTIQESIPSRNYKWLCWLILLGRSIPLKSAARLFEWNIPGKLPHYLAQTPNSLRTPTEGIVYAEILRLGGTERDFRRIIADGSYTIDLTNPDISESERQFWQETVYWLIAHREELTNVDSQRILAWARHCHSEERVGRRDTFRWSGRTVRAAREQAEAYEEEQYAWLTWGHQQYHWEPHGWNWSEADDWSITELTSSKHLADEGIALRHCVGSYGWRCHVGTSAIFSVRYRGQRRVTVEICPQTKALKQIHGLHNRNPTSAENDVVSRWQQTIIAEPELSSPP